MLIISVIMPIISISLNDKILKDMDKLQRELGFTGRSEVIRTALRMLLADKKEMEKLSGIIDGIMIIIHDDDHSEAFSKIRHNNQEIIQTQVHNHLQSHKCMEILILKGDAEKVKRLSRELQTNRNIEYSKLMIT